MPNDTTDILADLDVGEGPMATPFAVLRSEFKAAPHISGKALIVILSGVMRFVNSMNAKNIERNEKLAALEARMSKLETGLKYCDVWQDSEKYQPNNFVTWGGSLWCAKIENVGTRPGTADGVWKLAVKHGRDGKDLR